MVPSLVVARPNRYQVKGVAKVESLSNTTEAFTVQRGEIAGQEGKSWLARHGERAGRKLCGEPAREHQGAEAPRHVLYDGTK